MQFDELKSDDPRWWSKTLERGQDIKEGVQSMGRNFWNLETLSDGSINIVRILDAEGGTLYFTAMGLSTRLPIRIIGRLNKDLEAEKRWNEIQDGLEKEAFVDAWTKAGTTYNMKREWG